MDSFLTTALCGFAKFSADLQLRHANGPLAAWLGYAPLELEGTSLNGLLDGTSTRRLNEEILPHVREQAHTHAEPVVENLVLRTREGEDVPVLASFSLAAADSAAPAAGSGAMGLTTPLPAPFQAVFLRTPTPQQSTGFPSPAAGRETAPINEGKVKTLSQLSHELRSPLQSISLTTYVLLDEDPGPINEEQRADLLRIQRAAQEVGRLVSEILAQMRQG
jgi:hypothetical protein